LRVSEFGVLQQFVKSSIHSRFYFCLSRRKMVNHPRRYSHLSRFLAPRRRDTTQGKQCRAHPRICLRACARACRRSYSRPSNHSTPILTSIQSQHSDTHVHPITALRYSRPSNHSTPILTSHQSNHSARILASTQS
jgi:hypothetical protein